VTSSSLQSLMWPLNGISYGRLSAEHYAAIHCRTIRQLSIHQSISQSVTQLSVNYLSPRRDNVSFVAIFVIPLRYYGKRVTAVTFRGTFVRVMAIGSRRKISQVAAPYSGLKFAVHDITRLLCNYILPNICYGLGF